MSNYLSELHLKYGDGWKLSDWRKACYDAYAEVDRLRVEMKYGFRQPRESPATTPTAPKMEKEGEQP